MHEDVPDPAGAAVLGYRVERLIGIGGAAAVYEARRLGPQGPGQRVACKVGHAKQRHEPGQRELVRREAVLGLRVTAGHRNLIEILDFFDDAHARQCIVMELVDGASVGELRGPDRRLPFAVTRRIAVEVLEALAYLHGRGVLHRDLSPRNILVTAGGVVKLADLGNARPMTQGLVHTETLRGTPMYVAREAIERLPLDVRADLFSLGAILYELVAGTPPCGEPSLVAEMLRHNAAGEFAPLPPDTPADLAGLITGLIQPARDARRPRTAADALALLRGHEQPMASEAELAIMVPAGQARRDRELAGERPPDALPPGHVLAPRDAQNPGAAPVVPVPGHVARQDLIVGRVADAVPHHVNDPLPARVAEQVIDAVVERVLVAAPARVAGAARGRVTASLPGRDGKGGRRLRVGVARRVVAGRAALVAAFLACVLALGFLVQDHLRRAQDESSRLQAEVPAPDLEPARPVVPVPLPVMPGPPEHPGNIAATMESRRAAGRTSTLHREHLEGQHRGRPSRHARVRGKAVQLGDEPPPWARP